MKTVGQILRAAREGRGLDLDRVANDLRISTRYLAAIEADDASQLPGAFFYKAFVRQYADFLDLADPRDCGKIAEALAASELATPPTLEIHKSPIEVPRMTAVDGHKVSAPDYRRWALALFSFVAVVAVCGLIYAGWQRYLNQPVVTVSREATANAPAPPGKSTTPSVPAASETAGSAQPADQQAGQESLAAASNASYSQDNGDVFAPIRVTVRALEATWVRVTGDGTTLFVGLLEPRSQRSFTGNSQARMLVGNAGGLEVKWNGQQIGTIGPRGQVRVVEFTPENYQILQLPPKHATNEIDREQAGVD